MQAFNLTAAYRTAKGTRTKDIRTCSNTVFRRDNLCAKLFRRLRRRSLVNIGDNELSPFRVQQARQFHPDSANTQNRNGYLLQGRGTKLKSGGGLDAPPNAARGEGRWIAALPLAGNPCDKWCLLAHDLKVVFCDTGVFRSVVAPLQTIDRFAVSLKQLRGLVGFRISNDYSFTATKRDAAKGVFVGHAAREFFNVLKRFLE